jgi:hypothetical protein
MTRSLLVASTKLSLTFLERFCLVLRKLCIKRPDRLYKKFQNSCDRDSAADLSSNRQFRRKLHERHQCQRILHYGCFHQQVSNQLAHSNKAIISPNKENRTFFVGLPFPLTDLSIK